jgi:hypothetical protein
MISRNGQFCKTRESSAFRLKLLRSPEVLGLIDATSNVGCAVASAVNNKLVTAASFKVRASISSLPIFDVRPGLVVDVTIRGGQHKSTGLSQRCANRLISIEVTSAS